MTSYRLFLDDERLPADSDPDWVVVRSSKAAIDYLVAHGMPAVISFDHDLGIGPDGQEDTAMVVVDFLINVTLDRIAAGAEKFLAPWPAWKVHSANPIGAANVEGKLQSFERHLGRARAPTNPLPPTRSQLSQLPLIRCTCGWIYAAARLNEIPGLTRHTCWRCGADSSTMSPAEWTDVPLFATPQPIIVDDESLLGARRD